MARKKKIAILGGGGGLSAAYQFTCARTAGAARGNGSSDGMGRVGGKAASDDVAGPQPRTRPARLVRLLLQHVPDDAGGAWARRSRRAARSSDWTDVMKPQVYTPLGAAARGWTFRITWLTNEGIRGQGGLA